MLHTVFVFLRNQRICKFFFLFFTRKNNLDELKMFGKERKIKCIDFREYKRFEWTNCVCVYACSILFFHCVCIVFWFFSVCRFGFFCVFEINETLIWNYMKNKWTNKEWRIRVLYFIFFYFDWFLHVFVCLQVLADVASFYGLFLCEIYFSIFFVSYLQFYTSWTIFLFASWSLCNRSTKIFAIFLSSFLKSGENSRINFVNTQSIDLFFLDRNFLL